LSDWSSVQNQTNCNRMIKTDGTLWMLGNNSRGNLGNESPVGSVSSPIQVGTETDWTAIAGGASYSIGIRDSGKLFGWGRNDYGQIADAIAVGSANLSSPVQIGSIETWTHVSSGNDSCLGISDGKLYAWGGAAPNYGQMGLGLPITYSSPTQVGTLTDWTNIDSSPNFSVSVKANGTLWRWGIGFEGSIGIGTAVNVSSPIQVGTETDWTATTAAHSAGAGIR